MEYEEGNPVDAFIKEYEKELDALLLLYTNNGIEEGIERTLKLIFKQPYELKEQCQMCQKNRHDRCLVNRTFFFVELSYDCDCSCQSSDLRQRLKKLLQELEEHHLADLQLKHKSIQT